MVASLAGAVEGLSLVMMEPDDMDALAAEYVLGTLPDGERMAVAARRMREAALDAAISAWETKLGPLHELVPLIDPSPALKPQVLARIASVSPAAHAQFSTDQAARDNVVHLHRRVARWRAATLAATAMAASLGGVIVYRDATRPVVGTSYVAVLQKDAASPAFLMTVDLDSRTFTVRPVAATKQPGKSYELWLVSATLKGPKSLGLVDDAGFSAGVQLATYGRGDIADATYAVSLEPEGGSTTGAPTGPVLYAGKLVQNKP